MTREELKAHCERQVKACEQWAHARGEKPSGKIYEEHKLILELLEQDDVIDKIRTEIEDTYINLSYKENRKATWGLRKALEIIDKNKAKSKEER